VALRGGVGAANLCLHPHQRHQRIIPTTWMIWKTLLSCHSRPSRLAKLYMKRKGLPACNANQFTLCAPCYTILDVLVYAADENANVDQVALSSAEEDAKAVQLVQAVAMQIRNFNKMTVACSQATISSMDASVLTIKKANMTQEDHAILAATNIINANASTFFNL